MQRNLLTPVEEMGLDIRIETRTGDTSSDRKARQRVRPPQILLTTPESLSLLLSYPDSLLMFEGLKTIVVDEVHAFATGKRGDLLSPVHGAAAAARAGAARRVALSATVADADGYRALARARRRYRPSRRWCRANPAPTPTSPSCCPRAACPGPGILGATPPNRSWPRSRRTRPRSSSATRAASPS